jgi:hypothetical protein
MRSSIKLCRWPGAVIGAEPVQANGSESGQITQWEALLHANGARASLVARRLFEHLFMV